MALDLGELTVALEVENNLGRGLGEAKREISTLPPHAQREMARLSRIMDDEGKRSGGVLAQGIRGGLMRASPLIVAGVAGALSAGAPAMLAASTALFAGVGIAAAAQSNEVRSAWVGLGDMLQDEADEIAGPMTGTLVDAAAKTAAAYQRMKPELIDAIAAVAPQVDVLVDSLLGMTENALPGLARAAENAGPAVQGLGSLLESTGTGLGEFFDRLSQHSHEAGAAMAALGDTLAALLPTLGELLGQGAELAAVMLPALADGMGAVADIATMLGPALPAIVAGLSAMKIAGAIGSSLGNLAVGLEGVAARGGVAAGAAGRVGSALGSVASAAGPVGIGIGVISAAMMRGKQAADDYARAMLEGGEAADQAFKDTAVEGAVGSVAEAMGGLGTVVGLFTTSTQEAIQAQEDFVASMTPAQLAAMRLKQAENELAQALKDHGAGSAEAEAAQKNFERATANSARVQGELEQAISGVTQAMIDQANQALAAIDSGFAYQNSLNQLEDAQSALAETVKNRTNADKDLRTSQEDVARAQLAVEEQAYRTALAFGQQQADMSGAATDSQEYARIVQEGALQELYRLRDAAGPQMAGALSQQIAMLEASGVSLQNTGAQANATADRMRLLGLSVTNVPGYKGVYIDAPTEDQRRRLEALGYQVITLPNGRVYVTADTGDASARVASLQRQIDGLRGRTIAIQVRASMPDIPGVQRFGAATGGRIGDVVRGFSGGGKLNGPGTPTSDSIPALTYAGVPLRVSDEEWVIQARAARKYGDARMAAINAGTAIVSTPGRGLSTGGPVGTGNGATATHIIVTAQTNDERRIAKAISDSQRNAEFLSGSR